MPDPKLAVSRRVSPWPLVGASFVGVALVPTAGLAGEPGVLVIELDGGEVGLGPDDATASTTPISQMVGPFAAYGSDPERREALLQAVRADWADYDVTIASSRPARGDYAMVMVGPSNPFGPHVTGIATVDCDDAASPSSLSFAFYSADDGVPANVAATTISQEAAHGLGLEHVDGPGDIMLPVQSQGDSSFTDQCLPLSGPAECPGQHLDECATAELQNAHAELLRRFGARAPDTVPPTATVTDPADGHVMRQDEVLVVSAQGQDDRGLAEATLYIDGVGSSTDPDSPYGWEIAELPPGDYELYVAVSDLGGNVGMSEMVELHVRPADGTPAEDDDESMDDGTDGGTIPLPPRPPPPAETTACAVAGGSARGGPVGLMLLLGLVRRRRR